MVFAQAQSQSRARDLGVERRFVAVPVFPAGLEALVAEVELLGLDGVKNADGRSDRAERESAGVLGRPVLLR